jgi:hypothetical protein
MQGFWGASAFEAAKGWASSASLKSSAPAELTKE